MSEWEVAGGGGMVGLAGYVANVEGGSSWIDGSVRGIWRQVDVVDAAVNNGSV